VNADQAAVACAVHWRAERLIFLTDVDGVRDANGLTLGRLGGEEIPGLIASGAVTGGMLAKLSAVQEALSHHVPGVFIGNGHREGALDGVLNAAPGSRVSGTVSGTASGTMIVAPVEAARSEAIEAAVKGVD
jgi:acetylglutamate kinase